MDTLRIVLNVQDDHRRGIGYRYGQWKKRIPIIEEYASKHYPRTVQTNKITYFHPMINHDGLNILLGEDSNRVLIYGSDKDDWTLQRDSNYLRRHPSRRYNNS